MRSYCDTSVQWNRLQHLLEYAGSKVPYYRQLFANHNLNPQNVRGFEEFRQLPLLSKATVQERWSDFISEQFSPASLITRYTSGSSGSPLKLVKTRLERLVAGRHLMNARLKYGLKLPARWAVLGGMLEFIYEGEYGEQNTNSYGAIETTKNQRGGGDVLRLSCVDLSPNTLEQHIQELKTFQPTWIYSSPFALDSLAKIILERAQPLNWQGIQLVELAGEYLSAAARERIRLALSCQPVSQYACQEVWGIAFECVFGGMHVLTDNVYLEVVKPDGRLAQPGEAGEVVISSINLRAMPLIRYRLGDLASLSESTCKCGNTQPVINILAGRTSDLIIGQSNKLGSLIFDSLMEYMHRQKHIIVRQYRVIQRSNDEFEVWISPAAEWDKEIQETFIRKAWRAVGQKARFEFKFMDCLPAHPSGKNRSFLVDFNPS